MITKKASLETVKKHASGKVWEHFWSASNMKFFWTTSWWLVLNDEKETVGFYLNNKNWPAGLRIVYYMFTDDDTRCFYSVDECIEFFE